MGRKKKRLRLLVAQERARARQAVASPPAAKEPECALSPTPAPKKKVAAPVEKPAASKITSLEEKKVNTSATTPARRTASPKKPARSRTKKA